MRHQPYLTQQQVARQLQVTVKTINRMVKDGRLKAIQTGKRGRIRIPADELQKLPLARSN